jgi:hypothetical protein
VKVLLLGWVKKMTRPTRIGRKHVRSILVGFLAMLLSLIALAVILLVALVRTQREIAIGPVYLLVPALPFATGCYWSLRRSSRPQVPAKPPSTFAIIVKSSMAGVAMVIVSVIAYMWWTWFRFARNTRGLVGIDVYRLIHWPVFLGLLVAGFILEYRRASRRRSMLMGG